MDLRDWVLTVGERYGPERLYRPEDVARAAFPVGPKEIKGQERWRRQIRATRAAAIGLARQNRLQIVRRGQIADAHAPIKGLIHLRWIAPPEDAEN